MTEGLFPPAGAEPGSVWTLVSPSIKTPQQALWTVLGGGTS